jgi:hypothetical protein
MSKMTADQENTIATALLASGSTQDAFATAFLPLFERHYGRPFDMTNGHDLMLAEVTFSETFWWLGDDGKVYR